MPSNQVGAYKSPINRVGSTLAMSVRRCSAVWLLAIFVVFFSIIETDTFASSVTLKLVLSQQVTIGLLALALLVPLSAGAFDLAVGTALAFSMVITAKLAQQGWNPLLAGLVAVAACAAIGWVNGFIVVRLRVNSFIATLGVSQVLSALTLYISKNNQITGVFPHWFGTMTTGEVFGLNYDVYFLVFLAVIVWYVLEHTPIGRTLFAVGSNPEAARLAGIPTGRLIWGSLVFSSATAGIAGVLLVSKLSLFDSSYGPSYLFPAFAAVFFGATQFKNRANVWGTLIAMYALAAGVTGLELKFFGSEYWIDPLFQGTALLIAVALASTQVTGRSLRQWRQRFSQAQADPATIDDDDRTDSPNPPVNEPVPAPAVSRTDA